MQGGVVRFLLILAMVLAGAGLGPAFAAEGHSPVPACLAVAGASHDHGWRPSDSCDKHASAQHVCPGCAVAGMPAAPEAPASPDAAPERPHDPGTPPSLEVKPVPPPPRAV